MTVRRDVTQTIGVTPRTEGALRIAPKPIYGNHVVKEYTFAE